jgi:4-amino-4-deoxy-L-arabinose transferase-like glycosyltransferase
MALRTYWSQDSIIAIVTNPVRRPRLFDDAGLERHFGGLFLVCLLVFIGAFSARMFFFMQRGNFRGGDATEYLRIADNLAKHGAFSEAGAPPFVPTTRRAPLFPLFLLLLGEGSPDVAVATAHSILDALNAVLVLLLTRTVAPLRWALAGGGFYALNPSAISTTCTVLSEPLFTFLLTLAAALLVYALHRDHAGWTLAAGGVAGAAALCRPIGYFFVLAAAVVLVLWRQQTRRVMHALVFVAASTVTIAPWVVRSSRLAGTFVFVQSNSTVNFYLATRLDLRQTDAWRVLLSPREWAARGFHAQTPRDTAAFDRACLRVALSNIRHFPVAYLESRVRSFPHLFIHSVPAFTGKRAGLRELWADGHYGDAIFGAALALLFTALPFGLALAGLPWSARSPATLVAAVAWGYTLVLHLPMYVDPRYWAPVIPLLTVSAAFGAATISAHAMRRARSGR